jgi:hypothetical protein
MRKIEIDTHPRGNNDPLHRLPFAESYPHRIWSDVEEFVGEMVAGQVAQPYLINMVGGRNTFFRIAKRWWG